MVIFAIVWCHGNSLQNTHMNENGIPGVLLIFTVNARSLNLKLKQILHFYFFILLQLGVGTVKTVGTLNKRISTCSQHQLVHKQLLKVPFIAVFLEMSGFSSDLFSWKYCQKILPLLFQVKKEYPKRQKSKMEEAQDSSFSTFTASCNEEGLCSLSSHVTVGTQGSRSWYCEAPTLTKYNVSLF